jgi:serine phosphatase RsbU (regulator of sigma subunit)
VTSTNNFKSVQILTRSKKVNNNRQPVGVVAGLTLRERDEAVLKLQALLDGSNGLLKEKDSMIYAKENELIQERLQNIKLTSIVLELQTEIQDLKSHFCKTSFKSKSMINSIDKEISFDKLPEACEPREASTHKISASASFNEPCPEVLMVIHDEIKTVASADDIEAESDENQNHKAEENNFAEIDGALSDGIDKSFM